MSGLIRGNAFFADKLNYLGLRIGKDLIRPSKEKIEVSLDAPAPQNKALFFFFIKAL